jgi:CRP-like cAMP-binding protein
MAIGKLVAPLLRVPLFAGLKPLQITEIARQAERCRFRAGDTITRAGEPADGAYLIASGLAERVGDEGGREPVEPGSLIGEIAMLVEHNYGATVAAREQVLCLKITRAAMRAQLAEEPALALHFQRRIAGRLSRVAEDLQRIDDALAACAAR